MAPLSENQRSFVKLLVEKILQEEKIEQTNLNNLDSIIEAVFDMYSEIVNSNSTPSEKHAVLIAAFCRILIQK